ncbi:MAG: hypothetical protein ACTSYC_03700 [Promethearchaeota archaeon]
MYSPPKNLQEKILSHPRAQEFLQNANHVQFLVKKISLKEFQHLRKEYPNFFSWKMNFNNQNSKDFPLYAITIVKHDPTPSNPTKLKKIKFYIHSSTLEILKILSN